MDELDQIIYYADEPDPPNRWPERDIDRHALCGWGIPHNLFARILLAERREWQVCCPDCVDRLMPGSRHWEDQRRSSITYASERQKPGSLGRCMITPSSQAR